MSEPAALEPEMGATGCKWYPGPLGAQLYIWLGGLRTFQLFYGESGGEREGERDRERETSIYLSYCILEFLSYWLILIFIFASPSNLY